VRRLVFFLSVAALSVLASTPAQGASLPSARVAGSESVELSSGHGYALLANRGSALGNVRRGWIRVLDIGGGGTPSGWVRGCESRSGRLAEQLDCAGSGLRFYVHGGTWRIRIKGRGINVSAVIRGAVGLDRAGCTSCTYRIGDGAKRRWPARLKFFAVRS
jgi:hypothetical protein